MIFLCLNCRNCDGQLFAVDLKTREVYCVVCGSNKIEEMVD